MKSDRVNWMWAPDWSAKDKDSPMVVLFRRELDLPSAPERAVLRISADSRYKLYLNGEMAEMGPSRGDRQVWFYDEVNLLPWLRKGKNVLAVQVLRYPTEHRKGNHGIFRTEFPGLFVKGNVQDSEGNQYTLDSGGEWKCRKRTGFHIVSEAPGFAPLQIYEDVRGDSLLSGWMFPGYHETGWLSAWIYPFMSTAVSPGNLLKRTIPFLYRTERCFESITALRQSFVSMELWNAFLKEDRFLTIAPHQREIVELTAGEEMTGYLYLDMAGGKGARIAILQSEAYVREGEHGIFPRKGKRDDWRNGRLAGYTDRYQAAGYGTAACPERYEPFWFRTFRFVRLEIETGEEPLTLCRFHYVETGYPLEIKTSVRTSDDSLLPIWEISERTLRRCMHETYEDCPFYEQLQYAMDSRSEILYTYAVSADDRLARKCMDDFRRSQRYDGLLNCSYPCYGPNVISGFSIYYILMLYDHMMYFGDQELLEEHLPTVEGILRFYRRNRTPQGYVAQLGGLNGESEKWSFIDWTPEWDATTGVPAAVLQGPITMESLLYVMGLQHAAKIAAYLRRHETADRWNAQAEEVRSAVRRHCAGRDGLLQDGPGVELYSQHVQVFAILTGTIRGEQARKNLEQTLLHPKEYAQCSIAMAFYLFRALQETGLYVWTRELWKMWTRMVENGATTCIEDAVGQRSDCHAWGALILYELPSVILGVKPAEPGYQTVLISPEPGYLDYAQGSVWTPKGPIQVRWDIRQDPVLEYQAPKDVAVQVDTAALLRQSSARKAGQNYPFAEGKENV